VFAFRQGDQERSRIRNEEALALARELGAADHARGGLFARRPLALTARAISG